MSDLPPQVHLGSQDWDAALLPARPLASGGLRHIDAMMALMREPGAPPLLGAASGFHARLLAGVFKPDGGFWTSSLRGDGTSAWEGMARAIGRVPRGAALFDFEVVGAPRLLELRDEDDVSRALRGIGLDGHLSGAAIARFWQAAPDTWDAIRVPDDHRHAGILNMWDVESTVWFRPDLHLRLAGRRALQGRRRQAHTGLRP